MRFDLSNIPSGATINSVTLQMNVQTAKTGHTDSVYEMKTGGWTETGATWNKKNGATWASGDFSTSDYDGTALGSIDPSSTGSKTLSNAALKTLVEAWVGRDQDQQRAWC